MKAELAYVDVSQTGSSPNGRDIGVEPLIITLVIVRLTTADQSARFRHRTDFRSSRCYIQGLELNAETSQAIKPVPVKNPAPLFVFLESVWFSGR